MDKKLEYYRDKKKLVKIQRDERIDNDSIHGFVLDYSDKFILLAHEYDFYLDGWRVIPRFFVTSIKVTRSCDYCKKILKNEGLLENLRPDFGVDLTDFRATFRSLKDQGQFIIVEDEYPDTEEFLIGPIKRISSKSVSIRYFDGIGKWMAGKNNINYKNISMIQFGSNYIRLHEKYIETKP